MTDHQEPPKTYTVGFSELNQALDCLMAIKIWMEEASTAMDQVIDQVLDTLDPSLADQLETLKEVDPEAFEQLKQQVEDGEADQGIATHVAEVIDINERKRIDKNPSDLL
tara:strand:- start:18 stop:347 length:330 start_codon:yes stop_codon:yes gene_type:complete